MSNKLLKYLENKQINRIKWEKCIQSSPLSGIYAMPWYLDITAGYWDALVWGDYEYVMPLPKRKKFGINYFYQPTFCQQLGIFPTPPTDIQKEFASKLYNSARFIQISTHLEIDTKSFIDFNIRKRKNLVLSLDNTYKNIRLAFSDNTKRNIKKAVKEKVQVVPGLNPNEFVQLKKELSGNLAPAGSINILSKIISASHTKGFGFIYPAYNEFNELCAAAFFLRFNNKIIYLNAFSTDEGKKNRAMFAIVNQAIKDYSGKRMYLDFEGSEIEGVARFYKGFGAVNQSYYLLYLNRLPFPINVIKKLRS